MPELPEVETVKSGLSPVMTGQKINELVLNRPNLRFPFPENMQQICNDATIDSIERRAKFLMFHLNNGWSIISHLGMSGRYVILPPAIPGTKSNRHLIADEQHYHSTDRHLKHDHVIFEMGNDFQVIFNDPRRFGYMDLVRTDQLHQSKHFKNLGPEPLGNSFSEDIFFTAKKGLNRPIKNVLLDQNFVAGLGNIYVCEALFRTGIHPQTRLSSILADRKRVANLVQNIRHILMEAIEAGGSSLKDHRQTDGQLGYFQHNFAVYDKEGFECSADECKSFIERIVQSGRSSFYCPKCQAVEQFSS